MRTIVVIPTYDEAENILPLMREVAQQGEGIEVLVVDDHSPDGTWTIVEEESKKNPRVHLLLRTENRGRGLAGIDGFRRALALGADRVMEMDADFSHDPRDIPALLKASESADVVVGSRFAAGGVDAERGALRKAVTFLGRRYLRLVLGLAVQDPTSGYRCFRREALAAVMAEPLRARDPFIVTELLYRCCRRGFRIVEVPIVFHERRAGRSKLGPGTLVRYFFKALGLRFRYCS
jgi:dolichol-phosphate mannosyltransferase